MNAHPVDLAVKVTADPVAKAIVDLVVKATADPVAKVTVDLVAKVTVDLAATMATADLTSNKSDTILP